MIPIHAADPFAENVRSTPWLSPEQEQKTFHLPPGFDIQAFAAEPDIAKPMNMAFDEKGRLWVTVTVEYPYPVRLGKTGRDAIKILEDTNGDGRADRVTTYAEGLNIPIGIYPFLNPRPDPAASAQAGQESAPAAAYNCIVWSIPNIWLFQDIDGDGEADRREVLYGPLGWERDTHGLNSSFTRGFDGWLYATHGYNNDSTVRGRDGHEIQMNSGNTYRMRLDGARVEQNTWGQVNPFGLSFDALGNLYSADCHSEAVYQLLRGGYYPSFGKPDDGLGFAPSMIFHEHGSTAICGIMYYEDDQWPPEYRDNVFTGNVMTSKVDWDALTFHGSTPVANDKSAFVSTGDPWFRPVNLMLGPDGALYIADFYNRIIGHYEVPLNHPGRDRTSGRIWRVFYCGANTAPASSLPATKAHAAQNAGEKPKPARQRFDISNASAAELISELASPNLTRRLLAMNLLADRIGLPAVPLVKEMLRNKKAGVYQRIHGLWILHRLRGLDENLQQTAATDPERGVRVHALRILSEIADWSSAQRRLALAALQDSDPLVQRCAAEALGQHPVLEQVPALLSLRHRVPKADTHLLHVVRMALRNQLQPEGHLARWHKGIATDADARAIADVAAAIPSSDAGSFLLAHVQTHPENQETLARYLRHAARYVSEAQVDELALFTREKFAQDLDLQLALFKSVQEGTAQRGAALRGGIRAWGAELAERLFASVDEKALPWHNTPIEGAADPANPWFLQPRASADGDKASPFLSSLPPGGEQLTGVLRSKTFALPAKLSFYLAGHDGFPGRPARKKNAVRLRAAATGSILAEAFPPRHDTAQPVAWDLSAHAGQPAYLEVIDGDNGSAFAWLAVGRFQPAVVEMPSVSPSQISQRQQAAATLVQLLSLTNLETRLKQLVAADTTDLETRAAVARALAALHPSENSAALAPLVGDPALSLDLRKQIGQLLANRGVGDAFALLTEAMRAIPYRVQLKLAQSLAGSAVGAANLLQIIEQGHAPARLLLERSVKDKLAAAKLPTVSERAEALTGNLTPASEDLQKMMEQRRTGYSPSQASPVDGLGVFTKNCAVCHSIDGQGAVIGPQLDGIGGRGLERLIEDVLDPNRNVDRAFRTHILKLKDGDVASGLPRREEGALVILADSTGKEFSVPKKEIETRRESESSLMPENFGDVIPPEDFNHLMAYLLSKGSGQK
ncbi:MAG: HEAT repeat domain-containing protein [Chloroflexi bacterium]|nr:HEAT repeat domain-containing protein [Chloroflexota bacterium]